MTHADNRGGTVTYYCTDAKMDIGDSGGPVWAKDASGRLLAVGINTFFDGDTHKGCFLPIETALSVWGAELVTGGPSR